MNETVKIIDTKKAAEILSSTPKTLYSWVHYKQIPEKVYRKIGRKLIFLENELLQWVLDGAELKKRTNTNTNENKNTNIKIENNNNSNCNNNNNKQKLVTRKINWKGITKM